MAQIAISITKRVPFRAATQEFSNVYHYTVPVMPNETEALARIDELTALEKTWHSTQVTFLKGRCWSSGGTPAANTMIGQKTLSGAGALTDNVNQDWERAFLFMWPAGFDSRGHPVFLRKWYHSGAAITGSTVNSSILKNQTGFSSTERTSIASTINAVRQIGGADEYMLCAESGRLSTGAALAHTYLEHHQLGDQWRAT